MKYKVGLKDPEHYDFFNDNKRIIYYDVQKEWAFTNFQLETYKMHKSVQSADLRDIVKWQRMEETFQKQYKEDNRILIEYES